MGRIVTECRILAMGRSGSCGRLYKAQRTEMASKGGGDLQFGGCKVSVNRLQKLAVLVTSIIDVSAGQADRRHRRGEK